MYLGDDLIAIRDVNVATGAGSRRYQHSDALGSPLVVTDGTGVVVEQTRYEPYGQQVNRAMTDGVGYTGHMTDASSGLVYAQQRYYDPSLGLFLSIDPVQADAKTAANFNRYAYGNNNPASFNDPDGRQACQIDRGSLARTCLDAHFLGIRYAYRPAPDAGAGGGGGSSISAPIVGNSGRAGTIPPGKDVAAAATERALISQNAARALPELRVSASKYPQLAENITNAQKAGHPVVVTHGGNAAANRAGALGSVPKIKGLSRDEYPFASSMQGGQGSWVGHVPGPQQSAQGALIRNFVQQHGIKPGDQYRVIVVP